MSNKNFDRNTITNFVNGMKGHNGKISFTVDSLRKGFKAYKKKNNGRTVSNIETFKNLKKNVLLEIMQAKPDSEIAQEYNKFKFENTVDLKKEDLLNELPLSDSFIKDLLDLVDNFCLTAEDFKEAKKIFSDVFCIAAKESDLRKVRLKFISKFKKGSLSWKQFETIWKTGNKQQVNSESIYFSDYVEAVHLALQVLKKDQKIDYWADFIKNCVVNILQPHGPGDEDSTYIKKHFKKEKVQQLGDCLFGVMYMMLIHSKEYLENHKMEAIKDFFGDNKKGSFSSKIGSNILEIIGGGFVGALSIVYLNDGCFEKSQDDYVVKLRDMLKENKCELKVENDEKGNQKIVFKNNQEKIVEQSLATNKQKNEEYKNVTVVNENEISARPWSQAPIMVSMDSKRIYYENDPESQTESPAIIESNLKIENPKEENTNDNKNSFVEDKESKIPIWLVALEKVAYTGLCIITFGILPLIKKLFSGPKISKLDQNESNEPTLLSASEVKGKNKVINPNIKLEKENNKNGNIK